MKQPLYSKYLVHPPRSAQSIAPRKHDYIDAVRGWAILIVITCHVGTRFPELPYPIKKLTNFGWHGVQMFFLASAVTLMMSWHRQKEVGSRAVKNFFVRRFLRIAPMYYSGAVIYYLVEPPESGFDIAQLLRSFLFINAWRPDWIPTTRGWSVVPGGWSIGVEFSFYLVFPILIAIITSISRGFVLLICAIILAVYSNKIGTVIFNDYPSVALDNFLYFWFPNQAPVFSLGMILYYLLSNDRKFQLTLSMTYGFLFTIVTACIILAEMPNMAPHEYFSSFTSIPTIFLASLLFCAFIFVLSNGKETIFSHPLMRRLGVLSFSCYVLHFLFIHKIPEWTGGLISTNATGYRAIGMMAGLWSATMIATVVAASLFHRLIEQPGIDLARRLTRLHSPPSLVSNQTSLQGK